MANSPTEIRDKEIGAGVQILKDMLSELVIELQRPEIAELSFTEPTFDEPEQVSLIDSAKKVVTTIKGDDLADAPATPSRRQHLKAQVRIAVIKFLRERRTP